MPKVIAVGALPTDTGKILEVADVKPYLDSGKYILYDPNATGPATTNIPETYTPPEGVVPYNPAAAGGETNPLNNPWFGIPAEISGQMSSVEQAKAYKAGGDWINPSTGQPTPIGVGMPKPIKPMAEYIPNEQVLQSKRDELSKAGIPPNEWNKYITSPDAQGKLYYNRPATLISPTGEKKVVPTGSPEANQLFSQGWTLMGAVDTKTITSPLLTPETDITIGQGTTTNSYLSDTLIASAKADVSNAQKDIQQLQELLTPPKTDLSNQVNQLLEELDTGAETLTGRGKMQLSEEQKQGIEDKKQAIEDKTAELNKKLAEIDSLTSSYNLANQQDEGRPMTLARIQGAQAQNYKMYLAQKNSLTSEAGYLQAELLGLQGKLTEAQAAADRAVDLEYSDRLDSYNAKLSQLNILLPQLEAEEARYGSAVQLYLQQQADTLTEQKQAKSDIMAVKLKAITSGINDPSILARIGNASSYNEALQILGENIPTNIEELTPDYKNYLLAGGEATGMSFAEWQGKTAPIEESQYMVQTASRALQTIDELLPQVGANTVGWGAFFLNKLPETEARNFSAQLDTLKSNIAFGALTAMREASKTGGALGQVSDREGKLLESTLGALDQLQSPEQLTIQLNKIKESILRWSSALQASYNSSDGDFSW